MPPSPAQSSFLDVAVALIRSSESCLLTSRAPDRPGGGIWELPGGKVEAGEAPADALARELVEELGIQPRRPEACPPLEHSGSDIAVRLHPFVVTAFSGQPEGREGQQLRWVAEDELWAQAPAMPGANEALLHHLARNGRLG